MFPVGLFRGVSVEKEDRFRFKKLIDNRPVLLIEIAITQGEKMSVERTVEFSTIGGVNRSPLRKPTGDRHFFAVFFELIELERLLPTLTTAGFDSDFIKEEFTHLLNTWKRERESEQILLMEIDEAFF